ncbi:cocosin 1-like [Typha angustifolia]|uniref:cocosin 1-like n=1 Tax=Typha angustifolia TaxID=59011 RepID=UPI003C2FDB11
MSTCSLLSFSLCFLVLFHGSLAQLGFGQGQATSPWQAQRRFGAQRECRLERLDAIEPLRRVQSEAGFIEYFDQNNEQLRCAGVSAKRVIIQPRGLLLPSYYNAPSLVYVLQGRGITGKIFPGCPETYQSFHQQIEQVVEEGQSQSERFRDEHQKIIRFREGDILAVPAGIAHWCYNDGDAPVITVVVSDTSNSANQLDPRHREFLLAGRRQGSQQAQPYEHERGQEQEQHSGNNVLSGFSVELLAEALGVSNEVARRLQNQNDQRGQIVRVDRGLHLLKPSRREQQPQEEEEEEEEERRREERRQSNGLDEAFCTMRTKENINDPNRADIYNQQSGWITYVNNQKLPALNLVQMSALRGVLRRRNAMVTPFWNINAHSIMYVTGGRGRVQAVDSRGRSVFDGEVSRGQLLVIPQNYAVVKRAVRERFEWVSFKTNSNAMVSQIAGKASAFRGLPVDVIANAYQISREEARRVKFNRGDELGIFTPRLSQAGIGSQVEV